MPELPQPKVKPHPWVGARSDDSPSSLRRSVASSLSSSYVELQVTTNFTFLTGASHPEELVHQAAALGHRAAAITDTNTLAGIVRAHLAAKEVGIPLVVGCKLQLALPTGGEPRRLAVLVYPTDLASYGRLCRLLTLGKRRTTKGECQLVLHDLIEHSEGLLAVVVAPAVLDQTFVDVLTGLKRVLGGDRLSLASSCLYGQDDRDRLAQLAALAERVNIAVAATNDVHYHVPQRRPLQDVLTCIRLGRTLDGAGMHLFPHAERSLKPPDEMARLFADYPKAIGRTLEIAERASAFNLDALRYQYPDEVCPSSQTPMQHLVDLTWRGAGERYPDGVPAAVRDRIEHEFRLIDELCYAPYFLTVHDLVSFARSRGILCQGRGAAANSAVCYCLGVTAVDPDRIDLLFERFISRERNEPPDIDIDFEHERREEVIQYIYGKYGRDRAALVAEVITYRGRSAVREVGKALGLSLDCVDRLAKDIDWWRNGVGDPDRLRAFGLNPADPTVRWLIALSNEILGFPRHLSQHVGGFVITRTPLCELVPIENAAMPDRTVIEWDKDDVDAMGMLKVDVLGLGMLTCIRKAFELIKEATKRRSDEATKGIVKGALHANVTDGAAGRKSRRKERAKERTRTRQTEGADISRSHCLAASDGACQGRVRRDKTNAGFEEIRTDDTTSPSGSIGAVEYRRVTCPPEPGGLSQASENCSGLAGGDVHATRAGHGYEDDSAGSISCGFDERRGSHSARVDQEPGSKKQPDQVIQDHVKTPSSLRRFVASSLSLHTIPPEDPTVYDMICAADTIGVFQIESRAQMTMLPRLRPRCFYDLVIEVAIVRPGPIQGDMVHPYLRRRRGEEPVTYPSGAVKRVLAKTLGVPLFQEQAMALAIVAAGFTPGEADQLRRAMAAWKRKGNQIQRFGERLISGMVERGYEREFAERCFDQIKGFSEYGFPESHAASFAWLVYVSAWLKKHYPAVFAAALINSQPMGFYAPAQIVRDAQEHGVEVRPVDVNFSGWDCLLEESDEATKRRSDEGVAQRDDSPNCSPPSLRLGLRLIKGMRQADAEAITRAVEDRGPFSSIEALWRASGVSVSCLRRLAGSDAFASLGIDRQKALWHVRALRGEKGSIPSGVPAGAAGRAVKLPVVSEPQKVVYDYASLGLSLKAHPVSFIRSKLADRGVTPAAELKDARRRPHGARVSVAGMVLVRQRPATASGIIFMTLEDETGIANLVVRPRIYERDRKAARHGVVLLARGRVERDGDVVHVLVDRLDDLDDEMAALVVSSRNFH